MTLDEVLTALDRAGTAQNRKVYARHGVKPPLFGVSYAYQRALAKRIGTDHELALALWADGNHDARLLATMVADPDAATATQVNSWVRDLDNYVLSDAVTAYVVRTPLATGRMEKWRAARGEWTQRVGWSLVTAFARDGGGLDDTRLEALIPVIERQIHVAPNRARDAMLSALIAIGLRSTALRRKAEAAARLIGPVSVNHGETGCKTPEPVTYLARAWAHKEGRAGSKSRPPTRGRRKSAKG